MSQPTVMWYTTRGAGFVSLLLLTAVMVMGILPTARWRTTQWPRFFSHSLHRYLSLVSIVFLVLHIATSIVDPFAKLTIADSVVPFMAAYRPIWLGLGVVSMELLIALIASSLLSKGFRNRWWRAIHWLAYACWPVAMLHGLGTGTDTPALWGVGLYAACLVSVLVALTLRLGQSAPGVETVKLLAGVVTTGATLALVFWTISGPLHSGWAAKAGTPADLLGHSVNTAAGSLTPGLNLLMTGTARQNDDGSATVRLNDENGYAYVLTLGIPPDQSGMSVTVSQSGATECSTQAITTVNPITATCGSIHLSLSMRISEAGTAKGVLTTTASS